MSEKEFATAMKTLGIAYNREITKDVLKIYYEILKEESYSTMKKAISETIKNKKFFPTVSDLVEECKKQKTENGFKILEFMKKQNYFHNSDYPISEYEKAYKWLETGIVPSWFKEDMKRYGEMLNQKQLENKKMLEVSNE